MRISLPNLVSLHWLNEYALSTNLLDVVAKSKIRHLTVHYALHEREVMLKVPKHERRWSLQSLKLKVLDDIKASYEMSYFSLPQDLLLDNAPSLQKVLWTDLPEHLLSFTPNAKLTLDASTFPQFPLLEVLAVKLLGHPWQQDLLSAMLSSPCLRILDVEAAGPSIYHLISHRGGIPSLKSLIWHNCHLRFCSALDSEAEYRPEQDAIASFCRANTQLEAIAFPQPIPTAFIEGRLLPVLALFRSLSSLALIFGEAEISEPTLNMIAQISSLERLWLSAGNQSGWKHDWSINHVMIRTALAPLQRLEKIAFTRDSYDSGWGEGATDYYYARRMLPPNHRVSDYIGTRHNGRDEDDDESGSENDGRADMAWEKFHLLRVMNHAKKYSQVFPRLNWVYVGQLPIAIVEETRNNRLHKKPMPVTIQRDDRWSFIKKMWGMIL
jgi:hypothetical protein